MDWIKEAIFVASAAYIYQEITHQKIMENDNLKYATIGGIFGLLVGPKLEQYIRNEPDLSPEAKNKLLSGALFGAAGYAFGDKIVGQAKKTFSGLEKKVKKEEVRQG
jgi:hypothetical protein